MTKQPRVREFSRTALALAVLAAFASAQAQDKKEEEKKSPIETSITLEGGATGVSGDALDRAFWGQYNGMRLPGRLRHRQLRLQPARHVDRNLARRLRQQPRPADARTRRVLDPPGRMAPERELRRTVARQPVHGQHRGGRARDRAGRELSLRRSGQRRRHLPEHQAALAPARRLQVLRRQLDGRRQRQQREQDRFGTLRRRQPVPGNRRVRLQLHARNDGRLRRALLPEAG